MTYKKVHRFVWLWAFAFMFTMIPGMVFILVTTTPLSNQMGHVVNRPMDWIMVAHGVLLLGMSVWCLIRARRYVRLREEITKVWEKKFDDVEFLEFHARQNWRFQGIHLRDSFPGMRSALWCISKLWAGRKTSEWVHLDSKVADDVVRDIGAKIPENVPEFYKCLLAGVLYGVIEPTISEPRALRIGTLIFQCAKEHYPLEKFELPTEGDDRVAKPSLAT